MKTQITLNFESPAFDPEKVQVREIRGRERLSELFQFEVHIVSTTPEAIDDGALLTQGCRIVFIKREAGGQPEEVRSIYGMVKSVRSRLMTEAHQNEYILEMVPRAWQSTLTRKNDIYQEMDVSDIIQTKLEEGPGLTGDDLELRLKGTYDKREFIVQYEETDLNFVQRWTEHFGIFYFFDHASGTDKIIFTDDNADTNKLEPYEYPFMPRGEQTGVFELETVRRQVTTVHKSRDYNYRNPAMDVSGDATAPSAGSGEDNEFGTHVKTPGEATKIAQVRAEAAAVQHHTLTGKSEELSFTAGASFKLEGHPHGELELLLVSVKHTYVAPATGAGGNDVIEHYKNDFEAILFDTPFRPPRTAPKPRVAGVLNGIVQAEASTDFGALDDQGRYRVAFMYDSVARDEGKASRPLRMAQPSAGTDRGMHFPLKSGTEVLLYCVNGDPDRPIIAGAVPNPQTGSPVTSANSEKTHLKTNVSDMVFDDAKPRMKLSVDGTAHVFQVGQPNAPEEGVVTTTISNISSMTNNVNTGVSAIKTTWQDYQTSISGKDICDMAGVPNPWSAWEKIEAVLKAAVATAKGLSAAAGSAYQHYIDWQAREKKEAEDAQTKAREDAVKALAKAFDDAHPVQPPLLPTPNPYVYDKEHPPTKTNPDGTTSTMPESEWRNQQLAADVKANPNGSTATSLQTAQERVEEATKEHTEAEEAWKNSPANVSTGVTGEVIKNFESLLAAKDSVAALYSVISKGLHQAANTATMGLMAARTGWAKVAAGRTAQRKKAKIGAFTGKHNIQGSTGTTGIYGEGNCFVHSGAELTLYGCASANVLSGNQVSLKAEESAEMSSQDHALVSSDKLVDLHSGIEMKLIAHKGNKTKAIPGGNSFYVLGEKGILMESETKDFEMKTKDNMKLTAQEKDMLIDAEKGKWGGHGKTQTYLGAGGGSGYGLLAKSNKISMGKFSSVTDLTGASPVADNGFAITDSKFEATIKGTVLTLKPSQANLKSGGSAIKIKKSGDINCTASGKFKANGSKVMLG